MGGKNFAKIIVGLGLLTIVLLFGYTDMITALASPSSYLIKVTASTSNDPYARRHWLNVNNNKMDLGVVAGTASWEGSLSLSSGDVI